MFVAKGKFGNIDRESMKKNFVLSELRTPILRSLSKLTTVSSKLIFNSE